MILMQELNLAYHYGHMFWKCACLSVNAGAIGEGKNVDYGKIAKAVSEMRDVVDKPDINYSNSEFTIHNDKILFGLRGISKVGDGVIEQLLSGRPYKSFEDYMERVGGAIKNESNINLIKSGAFDAFGDRVDLMVKYVEMTAKTKESFTMANIPQLVSLNMIPAELMREVEIYNFYKSIFTKDKIAIKGKSDASTWYVLQDNIVDDFFAIMGNHPLTDGKEYMLNESGYGYIVNKGRVKKFFDAEMKGLATYLQEDNLLEKVNQIARYEMWDKYCKGSIPHWEMESMGFYKSGHELDEVDKKGYNIVSYFDLSEDPEVGEIGTYRGKQFNRYNLSLIMGTVLSKNKDKHTVSLLTTEGVVTLKLYAGAFGHYDKTTSVVQADGKKKRVEESWFKKGTMILVYGFRLGDQFKPRKYAHSTYQHTIMKITSIGEGGKLYIQEERIKI